MHRALEMVTTSLMLYTLLKNIVINCCFRNHYLFIAVNLVNGITVNGLGEVSMEISHAIANPN